jgi:hypothetical protein
VVELAVAGFCGFLGCKKDVVSPKFQHQFPSQKERKLKTFPFWKETFCKKFPF